jgi:hypothetical protein
MRFALLLLLAVGTLTAAPVPKELKQPDEKALLVGLWRPADRNSAWFRFHADGTLQTWNPPNPDEMQWRWTDLDTKANPKRMTLTRVSDGGKYLCPYEITGDGMRFAFCPPGKELPADFSQIGGDSRLLTRDKPGK